MRLFNLAGLKLERVLLFAGGLSPRGQTPYNVIDKDATSAPSKWLDLNFAQASNSTLELHMPRGSPSVASYELFTANDNPNRDPTAWTLYVEDHTHLGEWRELDHKEDALPPSERFASYSRINIAPQVLPNTTMQHLTPTPHFVRPMEPVGTPAAPSETSILLPWRSPVPSPSHPPTRSAPEHHFLSSPYHPPLTSRAPVRSLPPAPLSPHPPPSPALSPPLACPPPSQPPPTPLPPSPSPALFPPPHALPSPLPLSVSPSVKPTPPPPLQSWQWPAPFRPPPSIRSPPAYSPHSYPPPLPGPPPPAPQVSWASSSLEVLCFNSCAAQNNGECQDGGMGSSDNFCNFGTDCLDCGVRFPLAPPPLSPHLPSPAPHLLSPALLPPPASSTPTPAPKSLEPERPKILPFLVLSGPTPLPPAPAPAPLLALYGNSFSLVPPALYPFSVHSNPTMPAVSPPPPPLTLIASVSARMRVLLLAVLALAPVLSALVAYFLSSTSRDQLLKFAVSLRRLKNNGKRQSGQSLEEAQALWCGEQPPPDDGSDLDVDNALALSGARSTCAGSAAQFSAAITSGGNRCTDGSSVCQQTAPAAQPCTSSLSDVCITRKSIRQMLSEELRNAVLSSSDDFSYSSRRLESSTASLPSACETGQSIRASASASSNNKSYDLEPVSLSYGMQGHCERCGQQQEQYEHNDEMTTARANMHCSSASLSGDSKATVAASMAVVREKLMTSSFVSLGAPTEATLPQAERHLSAMEPEQPYVPVWADDSSEERNARIGDDLSAKSSNIREYAQTSAPRISWCIS